MSIVAICHDGFSRMAIIFDQSGLGVPASNRKVDRGQELQRRAKHHGFTSQFSD